MSEDFSNIYKMITKRKLVSVAIKETFSLSEGFSNLMRKLLDLNQILIINKVSHEYH